MRSMLNVEALTEKNLVDAHLAMTMRQVIRYYNETSSNVNVSGDVLTAFEYNGNVANEVADSIIVKAIMRCNGRADVWTTV